MKKAVLIGLAQCLAIIPGISRSRITMVTMLHAGIDRSKAFQFTFIISIPLILGAFLLKAKDVYYLSVSQQGILIVGTLCSFVSGLLALAILRHLVLQAKMYRFGYYCILAGSLCLFLLKTF